MDPSGRTVYVVLRVEPIWNGNVVGTNEYPLKAFADRGRAEAYADRCRRNAADTEDAVFDMVEMEVHE